MSVFVKDPPDQTAASLVSGILGDLQHLVEQQFQLTRREIEVELRQRAVGAAMFCVGLGSLFLAALEFSLASAHLLHWAAQSPVADPARLPLWACHALVAAMLAIVGGILALVGRARFKSVGRFQNPATEILQEHVPWTTHPK
jgi:hypothetical protein